MLFFMKLNSTKLTLSVEMTFILVDISLLFLISITNTHIEDKEIDFSATSKIQQQLE